MKHIIFFISLFFAFHQATAQDVPAAPEMENIWKVDDVEIKPDFPGGIDNFYKVFQKKFVKPNVPGLVDKVVLGFVVEKDGSLTDIRIVHDAGFGTGEQAKGILESLPKWLPGTKDGKTVRVLYLLPIAVITE